MFNIDHNLHAFIYAVRQKKALTCTSEGLWNLESCFVSWIRHLFGFTEHREATLVRGFRKCLERLEKVPVRFMQNRVQVAPQVVDYQSYISAGEALLERTKGCVSRKAVQERTALMRSVVALRYRLEGVNGGLNPADPSQDLLDNLIQVTEDWKLSKPLFHTKTLSQSDRNILLEACQYPEFIKIILAEKSLLEEFLTWAIRDRISILPFITYPHTQKKIMQSGLNGRIGRMGGDSLKTQIIRNEQHPTGVLEKIVTLPFEGHEISILDDQRVVLFRGNYALTIGEIFELFKNKKYGPGNLEFMAEGIVNWNEHFWGWWDEDAQRYQTVDLSQEEWWKQLPIHEILTLKQVREKYGNHLDGRQWNFATIATRLTSTLDPENSHAYTSVAIPLGDSRYAIYPFGKYAFWFPPTFLEAMKNIAETVDATVAYPDENVYYTHRQRTRLSFALSEEQGKSYMESVKRDMNLSRQGNFVYQIESENCAKWAQGKMEEIVGHYRVPNLFQIAYLDLEPTGLLGFLYAMVKSLPSRWQISVTTFLHLPLGATKGKWIWENGKRVWKSLTHHSFWQDTITYHPGVLYNQQERGLLGRYVASGVRFTTELVRESYHSLQIRLVVFGRFMVSSLAKRLRAILNLKENLEKTMLFDRLAYVKADKIGDDSQSVAGNWYYKNSYPNQYEEVGMPYSRLKGSLYCKDQKNSFLEGPREVCSKNRGSLQKDTTYCAFS